MSTHLRRCHLLIPVQHNSQSRTFQRRLRTFYRRFKTSQIDLVANCPNYGEQLFASDPTGIPPVALKPLFQLNCAPAGTIQPAASLTFEMRLSVPGDDAPGTYALVFTLGYWNAMTNPTSAQVTISG